MPLLKHVAAPTEEVSVTGVVAQAADTVVVTLKPTTPKLQADAKPMTKDDYWRRREDRDIEKDKRIARSGVYQAALQSPALMQYAPTLEEYMTLVRKTADEGLAYVNEAAQ